MNLSFYHDVLNCVTITTVRLWLRVILKLNPKQNFNRKVHLRFNTLCMNEKAILCTSINDSIYSTFNCSHKIYLLIEILAKIVKNFIELCIESNIQCHAVFVLTSIRILINLISFQLRTKWATSDYSIDNTRAYTFVVVDCFIFKFIIHLNLSLRFA